ncbi:MAG: peptidoglycan DD-metalloendopeptidase family protein [Oscillospiraceae bacterium]|nr:peptidoglycan DD-metalloendopeptidase family protein [Oscillospiraceae bacterium]
MQYRKFIKVFFSLILVVAIVAQPTISYMNVSAKVLADQTDNINEAKEEGKQIEAALKALKKKEAEKTAIEEQLKKQIANTQYLISLYTNQISGFENEISAKEAEISKKNAELENTKYSFKQRLRSIYMSGGDITAISMLMSSDDFADLLSRAELTKSVSAYDNALMEKIVNTISAIDKSKAEIKTKKADKQKVLDEQSAVQAKLDDQFKEVSGSKKTISNQIDEKEADKKQNNADLIKFQNEQDAYLDSLIPKNDTSNIKYDGSMFRWPVPSCYNITSGFGSRWGTIHRGIDISNGSIYGKQVVAAADGVVINSYNSCSHDYPKNGSCGCGGGYGNNVVINHGSKDGNSYVTLYGHLRATAVRSGQSVKKGQVIGYVGCTGYSTGKHLHFEIRVNGAARNPMNYFN